MVALIAVAVHRFVLFGEDRAGEAFAFAPGRTAGLYLVMGVVIGTPCLAIDAVVFMPVYAFFTGKVPTLAQIVVGFAASLDGVPSAVRTAGAWISYAIVVLVLVRLIVWPASVVARDDVTWRESLALTRGKIWPLLALFILATVIVMDLELIWFVPYFLISTLAIELYGVLRYPLALSASFSFWIATVFLAALASFTYKNLRGYRLDETMPR